MEKADITTDWDAVDWEGVDQAALALMLLGLHQGWRTWKGFDWEVLNRLYEKGLITDRKTTAKSVTFTATGLEESQRLFERLFGRPTESPES